MKHKEYVKNRESKDLVFRKVCNDLKTQFELRKTLIGARLAAGLTQTELAEKLGTLPIGESSTRSFVRSMLAGAVDCEIDKQGRILIPDFLKSYADLDKDVIIAGVYNRLEIWDEKKWEGYKKNAEKNTDEIAEQLGKLGVY